MGVAVEKLGDMFTGVPFRRGLRYSGSMMKPLMVVLVIAIAVAIAAEIPAADLVQPGEVAARLASKDPKPAVFQVGPNRLYRNSHVPGSVFAGPGSSAEGIELLRTAVSKLPKDREIVLYCGCCPWAQCPNLNPAIAALKSLGYSKVKVMMIPTTFAKDWVEKGYAVESSPAAP
jgi:thiosulfate/3-mercaptopyruvate sulfurtransferase